MRIPVLTITMLLAIASCNSPSVTQPQDQNAVNGTAETATVPAGPIGNDTAASTQDNVAQAPDETGAPGTVGGLPDDRTALQEPHGPIDPKSPEAAGQVVQHYGALLEQRKFADARKLWGGDGEASGQSAAQFAAAYDKYAQIHSEVGRPTDMEGAAGSSYITVPFRLFGTLKSGGAFNLVGPLTLRRVNDVPGSTEEQRHWHIEKSGLKPRP
jgi:hypothetical protein